MRTKKTQLHWAVTGTAGAQVGSLGRAGVFESTLLGHRRHFLPYEHQVAPELGHCLFSLGWGHVLGKEPVSRNLAGGAPCAEGRFLVGGCEQSRHSLLCLPVAQ